MRDAMFQLMARDVQGFKETQVMLDGVHPSALGHRYLGDLVIAHLQGAAAEAVVGKAAAGSTSVGHRTKLPPPLFQGAPGVAAAGCGALAGAACARARHAWGSGAVRHKLRPSLRAGNYGTRNACMQDGNLHSAAVQPVEVRERGRRGSVCGRTARAIPARPLPNAGLGLGGRGRPRAAHASHRLGGPRAGAHAATDAAPAGVAAGACLRAPVGCAPVSAPACAAS